MTEDTNDPPQSRPLASAGALLLLGTLTFLVSAFATLHQLGRSNRPHELTYAPVVAVATTVALGLFVKSIRIALRASADGRGPRASSWMIALAAGAVGCLDLFLLIGAASAVPDVIWN